MLVIIEDSVTKKQKQEQTHQQKKQKSKLIKFNIFVTNRSMGYFGIPFTKKVAIST